MANFRGICGKRKRENQYSFKMAYLKDFMSAEPRKFERLVLELSDSWLREKLMSILSDKGIINLSEEKRNEILIYPDGWKLLVELMKINCRVGQLVNSMYMKEFLPAKMAMGINYEKMKVHKQLGIPGEVHLVSKGDEFILEFIVSGLPFPQFEWFCNGRSLEDENDYILNVPNFQESHQGYYCCVATQFYEGVIHRQSKSYTVECRLGISPPQFKTDLPPHLRCEEGSVVELSVEVEDDTNVTYDWWCDNTILPSSIKSCKINAVSQKHKGTYRCVVSSEGYSTVSTLCALDVIPPDKSSNVIVTAKLALLIGNNDYTRCPMLSSSVNDVVCIANGLKKIGFNVVMNLVNLDKEDMLSAIKKFSEFIIPDSYVFFYFSGHGFFHGHKFMMPIDSPPQGSFTCSDCISENFIKECFFKMNPKLYIEVLDMCLTGSDRSDNPHLFSSTGEEILPHYRYDNSKTTSIKACPTKEYQKAYENGQNKFYMSYSKCLSHQLDFDLPVNTIFLKAHSEFQNDNKMQQPSFFTEDSRNIFKLNVPTDRRYLGPEDIAMYLKLHLDVSKFDMEDYEIKTNSICTKFVVKLACGTISNVLEILFEANISNVFTIYVDEIQFSQEIISQDKKPIITIPNIQKIAGNIMILRVVVGHEETKIPVKKPVLF